MCMRRDHGQCVWQVLARLHCDLNKRTARRLVALPPFGEASVVPGLLRGEAEQGVELVFSRLFGIQICQVIAHSNTICCR